MTDLVLGVLLPAHGVGTRKDLPVPFGLALAGAAVALLVSFVALALLWRTPRLRGAAAGRPLPERLASGLDAGWFRWALRGLGLLATTYVLLGLLIGPDDGLNPSAGVVYVLFWVGTLAFASALLGPVWRQLNPWRTLHLIVCRVLVHDPAKGLVALPRWVGQWPAAVALFSFAWLELVAPDRATTHVLRIYVGLYALWVLVGAAVFGDRWIARADGFEAVSTLYGKLSVLGRRRDGVLVARSPLDGLAGLVALPGTAAVVCVLLGSTAYDGMSASPWWVGWAQSRPWSTEVVGTVGLLGMVLVVGTTYLGATWLSGRMAGVEGLPRRMPYELTHTIVPIALGYAVAHYYSLLVIVGQQTISALSDPLGTGANWLGTAEWGISYRLVGATTVATVQVLAVVAGHVVGVVLAHDRTVALVPARHAVRAQVPVLVLMVFYTLAGLTLLFST